MVSRDSSRTGRMCYYLLLPTFITSSLHGLISALGVILILIIVGSSDTLLAFARIAGAGAGDGRALHWSCFSRQTIIARCRWPGHADPAPSGWASCCA